MCMDKSLSELVEILHAECCSCVIQSEGEIMICRDRGVKDLYRILSNSPELLSKAMIADKVVGKGAAALMILGGVRMVYADVISQPAMELFKSEDIPVNYGVCVTNIINRAVTGICPVESLCKDVPTAQECLPLITEFITKQKY